MGMLIDHVVSRSVRDSALMLSLLEADEPPGGKLGYVRGPSPKRLRIGFYTQTALGEQPAAEVDVALAQTVALCRGLGHEVREVNPPAVDGEASAQAFFVLAGAGLDQLARTLEPMLGAPLSPAQLEPFTLELLGRYRALPEGAAACAVADVERAGAAVRATMDKIDVLLCPTMPNVAPPLGTLAPTLRYETLLARTKTLAGYTALHTFARVPAMSVPLAMSEAGLPIGSHFAARSGAEGMLLHLAYELEAAAPWAHRWPRPALSA